jgi:sporulation protein YlmC with PRC-barrel domain
MNAKELFDLEVVGSTAWQIGKVKDLVVDTKTWQVASLDIELEKNVAEEFNVKHRFSRTHIPLSVSYVQAVGDKIVLKSSKEEIFQQVAAAVAGEEREQQQKQTAAAAKNF